MAENSVADYVIAAGAFFGTVFSYALGRKSGKRPDIEFTDESASKQTQCQDGVKHQRDIDELRTTLSMHVKETDQRFDQGGKVMDGILTELKTVRSSVDKLIGWCEANAGRKIG